MKRKPTIRSIKKALKKPELYSTEEYQYLISNLYAAMIQDELRKQNNKKKGFGYVERKTNIDYSRSGEDDGLYCEGEQPIESGEPECGGTTEVLYQA
jgi:hypothetical protein